jgi:hypothetical protein
MTIFFMSSAETPARSLASWIAQTLSQRPASYSSFVSPMQSTGIMPDSRTFSVFLLTAVSSSMKSERRSLWPVRMYVTPIDLTIDAATAPV